MNRRSPTIASFKNIHNGETAVIICGGPSIADVDLSLIPDPTIGMNNIFLTGFDPTYYIIEDWLIASDRKEEIEAIGSIRFYGSHLRDILHDGIFIPTNTMSAVRSKTPAFSFDLTKMLYTGYTVTFQAIQLSFWMGFETVYLIGLDHNYVMPEDAERIHGDIFISHSADPNHFDPDYFGEGYRFHDPKPKRMEKAYQKAKDVFDQKGRKIYNATPGSRLNIFERKIYDPLTTFRN